MSRTQSATLFTASGRTNEGRETGGVLASSLSLACIYRSLTYMYLLLIFFFLF